MKRMKKNRLKHDIPETSTFRLKDNEEHDLAYYIHDRVELMHQVFSVIKTKDLKAMIPQCVKNISLDDLQELCTEELLGISSKRLCAILDGAEPPSDTESSSSSADQMETISLDSISSDEEILSQNSSKNKKHKHKKRKNKHKTQDPEKKESSGEEKNRASRAGLTVLELLELQARARAIRAQLQKDQSLNKAPEAAESTAEGSEDEVEIKEEPAEVVEISSEDEKPNAECLNAELAKSTEKNIEQENPKTVTKRINDLVITVPQSKQTRKIKLNRNKVVSCEIPKTATSSYKSPERKKDNQNLSSKDKIKAKDAKKNKSKKKDKTKQKINKKYGSDHDEITLQLSDSEKMDLLEDLDRKNYDSVSSSSNNSEESSDSDNGERKKITSHQVLPGRKAKENKLQTMDITMSTDENTIDTDKAETNTMDTVNSNEIIITDEETINCNDLKNSNESSANTEEQEVPNEDHEKPKETSQDTEDTDKHTDFSISESIGKNLENSTESADVKVEENELEDEKRKLSQDEISGRDSDTFEDTEVSDIRRRLSVSDDDRHKNKKEKKSKKKSKKSDENTDTEVENVAEPNIMISPLKDDAVNEIYELSDDSSCYEVEGVSVLSKEPTTVEIEALSAKVDDTIRENISDDVKEYEQLESEPSNAENISWKDRYLDSKKVKRVLKTSSILNAIRKKNKELKKKLEESKMITPVVAEKEHVEGTTDEYNTLEGSTKYVDPVSEKVEVKEVTKEMEKDAKQLLKMYKKLLKYNDINKKKDPNRKKIKKSKKKKQKHKEKESSQVAPSSDP